MPGRGARRTLTPIAALAAVAAFALGAGFAAAPARALAPPTPWDGSNPFNCVIQDAGLGPTGPDPGADPYCVRFDKTHQNVTQLGVVDFLLKEPARTAAAVPKCFYFQEDHWRGSIQQSDGTAIYEFVGHYFFNKATGDGGVWVTDFTLDGQTFDPTSLPGFPPGYGGYFGPGTGGFITHNAVPTDPQCVAQAEHSPQPVYPANSGPRCVPDAGTIDRRELGPVALGTREPAVRSELGPPAAVKRGFMRYCVGGGGAFLVGQPGDRSGTFGSGGHAPTVLVLTTGRGFVLHAGRRGSVTAGTSAARLRRAFPHARPLATVSGAHVLELAPRILAGVGSGHVRYLAIYDPRAIRSRAGLVSYLARSR